MAGHSHSSNIKHRKGAQDAKKAKLFTKLQREITVSAKAGQADPEFNARLRNAIIAARTNNMPKDRIDSAIKKATSAGEGDNLIPMSRDQIVWYSEKDTQEKKIEPWDDPYRKVAFFK